MTPLCILLIEDDDDRAFMEELYHNYQRLMYQTIWGIVKNHWDTEDIMQMTLIKLIDKVILLRSQERNKRINYIISACKNNAKYHLRGHSHTKETPFEDYIDYIEPHSDTHPIEVNLLKQEDLNQLERIWPKMDERDRHLLEGYYILEKTMLELGEELGVKPGSIRMALTRARRNAYQLLEKEHTL